jgi:FG-GAP-like repeat/Calx-beta domain
MATVASTGLNALLNETGKIYLSVDGKGTTSTTGTVRVLKNAGATVRKAYLVGDSINVAAVSAAVNNTAIAWDQVETTPFQGSTFYSYRTDVTSILKPTIDAAAAGTLNIAVDEGIGSPYEGLALAVVFDDPNQPVDQSVILYFGGLNPTGGTATINFATPVDTSATLGATFGLGIGYSYDSPSTVQTSQVKVNGQLLTSVAGGFDDGSSANGTLFTIGGIGDSPNNPSPTSTDYTTDDELYNLLPFIKNGDTALTLNTVNPSNDDHIFFAHLTLQGITATDSANVVKLSIAPSSVTEDGTGKLVYTFTRTGVTTSPLTVGYQVGGTATLATDYAQTGAASFSATTGTVTFAAGVNTATVTISPVADTVIEPDETVILTLKNGDGYAVGTSAAVTGTILNDDLLLPIITIAAGINAAEPATNGTFTLARTGDLAAALTVNLAAPTGTATSGVDYTALAPTATFAVGSATATVTVATIDDTLVEPTETIGLALATGAGYTLGTTTAATINLTDNDVAPIILPSITIAAGINAAEPATNGTFTLARTGDLAAALTVNLAAPTGTATSGVDYTALAPTATFAVGSATATVTVATIDDTLVEPTETIGLALANGAGYTLGTTTTATINLIDNDVAPQIKEHPSQCVDIDNTLSNNHDVAPQVEKRNRNYSQTDDRLSRGQTDLAANKTPTRNDFNSDGKSDILWRNDNGDVALWQMNGSTLKTASTFANVSTDWKISNTGDFSGDSKADILWRNTDGQVAIWQMNGNTPTAQTVVGAAATDWKISGTGDFNGDRKADILWRNTDGSVAIWQMNGNTPTAKTVVGAASTDWKIAGTGDFNGDGKSDMLWRKADGSVAMWQMNGTTPISQTVFASVSNDWQIAGTGDFNGDGKADILWRNNDGQVSIWKMNGTTVLSKDLTTPYPSVDNSWKISGTSDFNGDGKADILWRKTDGSVETWLMNGSTVTAANLVSPNPVVDNTWKIAAPIL